MQRSHEIVYSLIQRLVTWADIPKKEFTLSQYSYQQIYSMAAKTIYLLSAYKRGNTLCLCTTDKNLIGSALIASLASGHPLIIPYACSNVAVNDAYKYIKFKAAICNRNIDLPPGVKRIIPVSGKKTVTVKRQPLLSDEQWLILFTGGSTERPKTWSKTPLNILAEAIYFTEKYQITSNDVFIATVPSYHIYGLLHSIIIPFVSSASLFPGTPVFPNEIMTAIRSCSPSILISIPIHYRALIQSYLSPIPLRLALSSGAMLPVKNAREFFRQTNIAIVEIYGSTETGGIATRCTAKGDISFKPLSVVDWKIVNETLCVRSEFISDGLEKDEDGFFMLGDRAKHYDSKSFILLGRKDGIVKVGGKRIDIEEIKEVLTGIPLINNAVVICRSVGAGGRDKSIEAVIESDLDARQIRRILMEKLPAYAIPRKIKTVKHIPITDAGKNDWIRIGKLVKNNLRTS